MPVPQSTPIRALSRLLVGLTIASTESSHANSVESSACPSPDHASDSHHEPVIDPQILVEETMETLCQSSQKHLFTGNPIRSSSLKPTLPVRFLDNRPPIDPKLLSAEPHTEFEQQLQEELRRSKENKTYNQGVIHGLMATGEPLLNFILKSSKFIYFYIFL